MSNFIHLLFSFFLKRHENVGSKRNNCLLSGQKTIYMDYARDGSWDLYETLDSSLCRKRESIQGTRSKLAKFRHSLIQGI